MYGTTGKLHFKKLKQANPSQKRVSLTKFSIASHHRFEIARKVNFDPKTKKIDYQLSRDQPQTCVESQSP
jgi:hypothetical protein